MFIYSPLKDENNPQPGDRMAHLLSLTAALQDGSYALRAIRKDLGFFSFAILMIGLGIGASAAVFSVMSPLMLRPLPFEEPERLVWIANSGTGGMSAVTSRTSNLRDFRDLNQSFEGLTGYNAFFEQGSYNLVGDGVPERLVGVDVAEDFLEVVGVAPLIGRNFVHEEGLWGGRRAVILTHVFWTRRFGADPSLVGTSITLNGEPYEVVGVLPPTFDFASIFAPRTRVDFLTTFPISDETDRWGNTTSMIGRLKPNATVTSAQAELDLILQGLQEAEPNRWGLGAVVVHLQGHIAGPFVSAMLLLAAAAAVVMLIVCVNLSNLLLVKAPKRSKEMAVRSALGAPRGRILRQLLFESLFLALGGALLGVVFAIIITRTVASSTAINIPLLRTVTVDHTTLLFAFLIAILAGLLVGIMPALRVSDGGEAEALKRSTRGASTNRRSTRLLEGLVIAEVALACILLVFGGLLLKSYSRVLNVELGFQPAGMAAWQINRSQELDSLPAANAFFDQLTSNVAAIPGVEAVGLTDAAPLGRNRTWGLGAPGIEYEEEKNLFAFPHLVDSRYLQTMQIPLLAGRHFTPQDSPDSSNVIILNEAAARAVYHGDEVLGRKVSTAGEEFEVVGIVANVRHRSLEEESGLEMYLPMTQTGNFGTLDLVIRSSLPKESLVNSVATALRAVDPNMPTSDHQSLDEVVERALSPRRFTLILLGSFAGTALLLAALGIYGVLSYSVTERIPEIGIRMALGESSSQVLSRVVGKTLLLTGIGIALGAIGSFAVSRLLSSLLYGVQPTDPLTFTSMAIVLLLVSGLAGWLPALRASQTDPALALRSS
jgi:predicted permease